MIGATMSREEIRQECERLAELGRRQYCPNGEPEKFSDDDETEYEDPEFELENEEPDDRVMFSTDAVLKFLHDNQVGDAEVFKQLYRGKSIYDHAAASWYLWNGHYWKADETQQAFSDVQMISDIYRLELQRLSWRINSEKTQDREKKDCIEIEKRLRKRISDIQTRQRANDILIHARSGSNGLATSGSEWDAKPTLLCCSNGVLDLDSGEFRSGLPEDMIISHCDTEWRGADEKCPTWERFILEVMNSDISRVAFLKRALGYCASGLNVERFLMIFHGLAQNGKGTVLETLYQVLGDYSSEIPAETLLIGGRETGASARPDLMLMRGKRLCWASETNKNREIDGAKIKWLSGGDSIVCRQLFGKMVSFEQTAKIILLTNNQPKIDGNDKAIWARVLLIPFDLTFVPEPSTPNERKRDKYLKDKLLEEKSGILAWLYQGYQEWKRVGLAPPDSIKAATSKYREDNSTLRQFLTDCCIVAPGVRVKPSDLYAKYEDFCSENGLEQDRKQPFFNEISSLFKKERTYSGRWYIGIGLKAEHDDTMSD